MHRSLCLSILAALALLPWAQRCESQSQTIPAVSPPATAAITASPAAAGSVRQAATASSDQGSSPFILVPASDNSFTYSLSIEGQTAPNPADIKAGQLTNPEQPNLQVVPTVTAETPVRTGNSWTVPIKVSGLLPFGSSAIPIFNLKTKIDTLRIVKSGLSVESPTAAQQSDAPLLLVLRNPTNFHYTTVLARLRFKEKDVCTFAVERFPSQKSVSSPSTAKTKSAASERQPAASRDTSDSTGAKPASDCDDVASWTEFEIPRYSGVSLRAFHLPEDWFTAPDGYSKAAPQKGTLTLRFSGDPANPQVLEEQILPFELSFQPGTIDRSLGYFRVFAWLLLGALASLALRVAIPNYRRFRFIRDQLDEIRKTTRGISEEVDSMLRVQLRVENLSLGTLSRSVLVISPGYSEVALRVETAMATLRRRIDYVRRLDAALSRRHLLIADELAQPTRIAAIDRSLNAASEELKSDQFREQDWVFIQQALETADKILGNPSEEDKSTFETVLIQRWQNIAKQYGFTPDRGWTAIPPTLLPMSVCFPSVDALCPKGATLPNQTAPPAAKESDSYQWIKAAGTVRADLQITALELIREFQFLAPAQVTDHWVAAMNRLIPWLATPAFENLNNARLLLRELSEGISPEDIVEALKNGEAHIELDPQVVGSGERVHLAVQFWQLNWNSAAARQQIVCEWRFKAFEGKRQSGTPQVEPKESDSFSNPPSQEDSTETSETLFYREKGWEVYHYFDKAHGRSPLEVLFYFRGKLVMDAKDPTKPLIYPYVFDLQSAKKSKAYWDQSKRVVFESLELFAALLVPLCALAVSTADKGSSSQWWQLLGLGFGSDTIRNVLSGNSESKTPKQS